MINFNKYFFIKLINSIIFYQIYFLNFIIVDLNLLLFFDFLKFLANIPRFARIYKLHTHNNKSRRFAPHLVLIRVSLVNARYARVRLRLSGASPRSVSFAYSPVQA